MKDPIYDSKSKLAMIKEHCVGVVIRELDAGNPFLLLYSQNLLPFFVSFLKILPLRFKFVFPVFAI